MWKTYLYISTFFFPGYLFDNTQRGSDTTIFNLLSGNGIYNPMDPMGFIFEGKNEQYKGNGIDTPRYNPDKFAYKYAGTAHGPGVNPFGPDFVNSASLNNSPNYAHQILTTNSSQRESNVSYAGGVRNETSKKDDIFSQLPVAAGSPINAGLPEFVPQTFPENIMSALKANSSNMFPSVSFSGQPGMLGIGKQIPLQAVLPDRSPEPQRQYLPAALRNVSETRILSPVYVEFSGMEGSKQQGSIATTDLDTSTPKPFYSGYPGMLGVGQMYNSVGTRVNAPVDTRESSSSQSHSNKYQSGYSNSVVNDVEKNNYISAAPSVSTNNYMSASPSVNTNNWKGEWPGKTSTGGDWSGDWTSKWPKTDSQENNKDGSQFGNTASHSSSDMNWDGSWPGSTGIDDAKKTPSNDFGQFGETMATLEKLMKLLDNIPGSADKSDSRAVSTSFSQMVSSWKEDMKT